MNILADQLLNNNSISTVAFAFFTALLGAIAAVLVAIIQVKGKANEAANTALETKEEASKARKNTEHTANGFASGVDSQLKQILAKQNDLAQAFQKHLEWHVDHPPRR